MEIIKKVKIEILDPVYIKILEGKKLLEPCLSYSYERPQKHKWGTKMVLAKKKLFMKDLVYAGFRKRIENYCEKNNIELNIMNPTMSRFLYPTKKPKIADLNISKGERDYQIDLINKCVKNQRGVIKAATGSGKTILMLGLISAYPNARILFLCDTHQPITQFYEKLEKFNFKKDNIRIATIQSCYKNAEEYCDLFDIILIDECHSVSSEKGMYAKLLKKSIAPMRIGFTATLPRTQEGKMALEGLVGSVIGELTIQEGIERGVLVKPKIKLKMLPYNSKVKAISRYADVYDAGVVNNRNLNVEIVKDAKKIIDNDETVLILIINLDHGKNIQEMAKKLYNLDLDFVQGSTEKEAREEIRKKMIGGEVKGIIASVVFQKGLDIPNLNAVINGCQGKSETRTLQIIGRGLRPTEGKNHVKIYDYYNPNHRYLIDHFGQRLCLYFKEEWI